MRIDDDVLGEVASAEGTDGGSSCPSRSGVGERGACASCDSTVRLILGQMDRLRRTARRLSHCDADADDLVQETMLRAYRARHAFRVGTSIEAWTTTILRHVFLTNLHRDRRRGLRTATDAGDPLERATAAIMDRRMEEDPRRRRLALVEDLDDPVKEALGCVRPRYREAFLLSALEDLSCEEIARLLHIPRGTAMSRIHRAREHLRRELAGWRFVSQRRPRIARPREDASGPCAGRH